MSMRDRTTGGHSDTAATSVAAEPCDELGDATIRGQVKAARDRLSALVNTPHGVFPGRVTTTDFQGLVISSPGEPENQVQFKDLISTSGLLRAAGHKGIHVGIDGATNYSLPSVMHSASDVREFTVYVTVPGQLQREKHCVCKDDSCFSADKYDAADCEAEWEGEDGWIVFRLDFTPSEDAFARDKARFIHDRIVEHILDDGMLHIIPTLIDSWQERLRDLSGADLSHLKESMAKEKASPIFVNTADLLQFELPAALTGTGEYAIPRIAKEAVSDPASAQRVAEALEAAGFAESLVLDALRSGYKGLIDVVLERIVADHQIADM